MDKSRRNSLATQIFDCVREVHSWTGPGILAEVFKNCLAHEIRLRGIRFRMNAAVPVNYKGIKIDEKLFADFIIEEEIAIEVITGKRFTEVHQSKLNTILFFSGLSLGILIDPTETRIIDGFKKIPNPKKLSV
jgi:GxxExxY protein